VLPQQQEEVIDFSCVRRNAILPGVSGQFLFFKEFVMANDKSQKGGGQSAGKGTESAAGQQKSHLIFDSAGNPVPDPSTGEQLRMTQAQWRGRDKSLGYTRQDEDGAEVPDGGDTGGTTDPAAGSGGAQS
jgi:hypothetical protein